MLFSGLSKHYCYLFFSFSFFHASTSFKRLSSKSLQGIMLYPFGTLVKVLTGEGTSNPLQYSCLENPMDREAWWAMVHGVAKSWARLSDFIFSKVLTAWYFISKLL